jgi:hypothetical protein
MIRRRLRGVLGLASIWTAAWVVVLAPIGISRWLELPHSYFEHLAGWTLLGRVLVAFALWGALSGVGFASAVALLGRRRGWAAVRPAPVAIGGFLSGLVAPFCLGAIWASEGLASDVSLTWMVLAVISGTLNAALAAACLALIRRNSLAPPTLPTAPT